MRGLRCSCPPAVGAALWALACAPDAPAEDAESWPAGIEAGPVQACAAPSAAPAWVDVGGEWGLRGDDDPAADHTVGGTVVLEDLDGDGRLDLFVGYKGVQRLYLGTEAGFDEVENTPLTHHVQLGTLSLGDVDGDGRLDVIAAEPSPWFGRVRDGAMARVGLDLGFPWDGSQDASSGEALIQKVLLPADLEGDGLLDLFQVLPDTSVRTDRMLHGLGGLTWEWDAEESGPTGLRNGFDGSWLDWDRDADLDLYVVQDMGADFGGNQLFENRDGTLVDRTADCACGVAVQGMGSATGDVNRDGWADLYISAGETNSLLLGTESGEFVDVTHATNADPVQYFWEMGWGGIFADLDNDGWLDIVSARGDLWPSHNPDAVVAPIDIAVLLQRDGVFENQTAALGMGRAGSWRAAIAHDLNDDGVLDLLVTDTVDRPALYLSTGCTEAGWLEVSGPQGTRVEVTTGDVVQTGWVETQSSSTAARALSVHFGLGDAQTVDSLVVTLPHGETLTMPGPFEGRRHLRVAPVP